MGTITYKNTICPLDCPDSCGLIATVDDGRVTSLQGDREHPYTNGFICRKMRRYPERLYSDQRIQFPAVRTGKKGQGQFSRVSWDEALDIIAHRLHEIVQRHGGEALLPYVYAGNMGAVNRFAGYPLFHKLGCSRLLETICSASASAGWQKHLGNTPGCPPENAAEADLVVAWGINIRVSNVHFWQYVAAARKKGGRLLVIDPYRNDTARAADYYCQIKPGGDVALALAIMKTLVASDRIDIPFIAASTEGFDRMRSYLETLQWQELEEECGLVKEEIVDLAHLMAANPKTFLRIGIGLTRNSRGGMAVRAITSLAACLGLFAGGQGRGVLLTSKGFRGDSARLTYPSLAAEKTRVINMIHLGHALNRLTSPVKALLVYNSNPASVAPDSSMVRQGLAREDLFCVVHEQVMTPTARYADILLPATTFLENRDIYTGYGHFYLGTVHPVIEPVGEARSNFDFFQSLAKKMGFADPPFLQSCEERLVDYLQSIEGVPGNCDLDALIAGGLVKSTLSCAHGDVLAAHNTKYKFVVNDMVIEPAHAALSRGGESEDPDLRARFPFVLITPPHNDLLNSTFGELHSGQCGEVLVHPDDAAVAGVSDGQMALIRNQRGGTRRIARITEDTRRGVLVAEGLFWSVPQNGGGINDLTSQKVADMGGGATFHESLVELLPSP